MLFIYAGRGWGLGWAVILTHTSNNNNNNNNNDNFIYPRVIKELKNMHKMLHQLFKMFKMSMCNCMFTKVLPSIHPPPLHSNSVFLPSPVSPHSTHKVQGKVQQSCGHLHLPTIRSAVCATYGRDGSLVSKDKMAGKYVSSSGSTNSDIDWMRYSVASSTCSNTCGKEGRRVLVS